MPATLSRERRRCLRHHVGSAKPTEPAAADDKAQDNIRGVIDTTAQRLADNEPATGGPSIEGYTPGLADKIADILGIERKRRSSSYEPTATLAMRTGWWTASAKRSATYRSGASGCDVGRQALKQESGRRSGGLRRVNTARAIFRDAERVADEDEQKKIAEWARRSQSLERLKAMWTLAKADLAVCPEELDTDPMLLNVENGTVELRTGSLRPHLPEGF